MSNNNNSFFSLLFLLASSCIKKKEKRSVFCCFNVYLWSQLQATKKKLEMKEQKIKRQWRDKKNHKELSKIRNTRNHKK